MKGFLGIDVGSVSTNIVLLNDHKEVLISLYLRTKGNPIKAVQDGLQDISVQLAGTGIDIAGVATTGSARRLAGVVVGADTVKNEITSHAVAAIFVQPEVQTVIEIGGQDSKLIIIRNGVVVDFAMNTVCAAGTGSFLDHQAVRLQIPVEEFGQLSLQSNNPVRIAGRCSVFAESDMIHKQQMGYSLPDIIAGLCEALTRNYLNNLAKGKDLKSPVLFQGGVAANVGIKDAFEKALDKQVLVPEDHHVMGAIGAAIIARETVKNKGSTNFKGLELSEFSHRAESFECNHCPNICEIINIFRDDVLLARWGSRCGRWEQEDHHILTSSKRG